MTIYSGAYLLIYESNEWIWHVIKYGVSDILEFAPKEKRENILTKKLDF